MGKVTQKRAVSIFLVVALLMSVMTIGHENVETSAATYEKISKNKEINGELKSKDDVAYYQFSANVDGIYSLSLFVDDKIDMKKGKNTYILELRKNNGTKMISLKNNNRYGSGGDILLQKGHYKIKIKSLGQPTPYKFSVGISRSTMGTKVKLSKNSATYTGKTIKTPILYLYDPSDTTRKYKEVNCIKFSDFRSQKLKNIGRYYIGTEYFDPPFVQGKDYNWYYDQTSFSVFTITPVKASVTSIAKGSKKIKVSVKKNKQSTGYEMQIATNKKFTKGKKTSFTKATSKTFKNLKSGKTYYVRVRNYKTEKAAYLTGYNDYDNIQYGGPENIYGSWSKVKKVWVQ